MAWHRGDEKPLFKSLIIPGFCQYSGEDWLCFIYIYIYTWALIQNKCLTRIGNFIVEIRQSYDRLFSTMGFPILVRWHLHIESGPWARFLSHILSQVSWQVTWPRLRPQVTCGTFCLSFFKWLHKSLGPKSLGLFWNAPYCFPSDALLTSPDISVNTIVTSHVSSIVTSLNAAP